MASVTRGQVVKYYPDANRDRRVNIWYRLPRPMADDHTREVFRAA